MLSKLKKATVVLTFILMNDFSLAQEAPPLNKENFSQYFEALESRDYSALRDFYAEDIVVKFGQDVLDLDGVIEYERQQAQFADISMDIMRVIGDESAIAVEAVQTQTMTQSPPESSSSLVDTLN